MNHYTAWFRSCSILNFTNICDIPQYKHLLIIEQFYFKSKPKFKRKNLISINFCTIDDINFIRSHTSYTIAIFYSKILSFYVLYGLKKNYNFLGKNENCFYICFAFKFIAYINFIVLKCSLHMFLVFYCTSYFCLGMGGFKLKILTSKINNLHLIYSQHVKTMF